MNSRRIAHAIRRREQSRATAQLRHEREQQRALARRERRIARRLRRRVVVVREQGHQTLVFRGPHASFDFVMVWGMIGCMVVLPGIIGLGFVLPLWATALLLLAMIAVYVFAVASPYRLTVTEDGYFLGQRAGMPWTREVGRVENLKLDLRRSDEFFHHCEVERKRTELFDAHALAPEDVAVIEAFDANIRAPRALEPGPHLGAYRHAS